MTGKLYLCATPIGNLSDITLRVLDTLKNADIIAAEDTRHTKKLLNHYGIKTKLTSYHEHNKYEKADELTNMLISGKNIALVTDAGTPGISDPGEELVKKCYEEGIEVTSLPGPSALIVAASMSGLSLRRFVFEGFLPAEKKERKEALLRIENETRTVIIYEAPHRILKTLKALKQSLGNRNIKIARELTKIHEEIISTDIEGAIKKYENEEPKGEMVVLIEGRSEKEEKIKKEEEWKKLDISNHMELYLKDGIDEKEAMKLVAKDRGLSKREIYQELKTDKKDD